LPLLKELQAKHSDLAILGIALDKDAKAMQDAIQKHNLPWRNIRDGEEGPIAKLFNVEGTPANYLLNRDGRIVGKMIPSEKLLSTITDVLANKPTQTADDSDRDQWQKPDEVIQAMNLKPGQVIVDIGAGNGYFTRRFATTVHPGGKAIGIEVDAAAVRALNADARRVNLPTYEARLVPTDDPMLAPNSVDVIFLCDAYHHIDDRVNYFARVKAALRPGGKLVVVDYVKAKDNDEHAVVREAVIDELKRAGYELTQEFKLLLPRQYFFEFKPVQK
jgi:predicted methyltransferase